MGPSLDAISGNLDVKKKMYEKSPLLKFILRELGDHFI